MIKRTVTIIASVAPAMLLALAAASSWLVMDPGLIGRLDPVGFFHHLSRGELLWHGLPGFDAYEMPLPVIYLMPFWHIRADLLWLSQFFIALLTYAELAALGDKLRPGGSGRLAGCLFLCAVIAVQCWSAITGALDLWRYVETAWFTLSCLSVLAALLIYIESQGPRKACLLGCAIGASFLVRSTLFMFPVVLAACGPLAAKNGDERKSMLLAGAIVCLVSYAFLLPWIWMNYGLGAGFVPFELGRAACNIISGAQGFVETLNADGYTAAGVLAPGTGVSAAAYYLHHISTHKLDFAAAFALRAFKFVMFHPFYLALFAAAAVRIKLWRSSPGYCCFIAYFAGIHFFFPVEVRYFIPLYAVFLPVVTGMLPAGAPDVSKGRARDGRHVLVLIAIMIFAGLAQWTVFSYPRRAAYGKAGSKSLGNGGDLWMKYLYATASMASAPEKAALSFRQLYEVLPAHELLARLLTAQALSGRPDGELMKKLPDTEVRTAAVKTLILLYTGKDDDAFRVRENFLSRKDGLCSASASRAEKARCAAYAERFRAVSGQRLDAETAEATAFFPARARMRMLKRLSLFNEDSMRSLAIIFQEEGSYAEAREMLDGLIRKRPDDPKLLSDRAVQHIFLGDCGRAASDLRKALSLAPDDRNARMNYDYLMSGAPACGPKTGVPGGRPNPSSRPDNP